MLVCHFKLGHVEAVDLRGLLQRKLPKLTSDLPSTCSTSKSCGWTHHKLSDEPLIAVVIFTADPCERERVHRSVSSFISGWPVGKQHEVVCVTTNEGWLVRGGLCLFTTSTSMRRHIHQWLPLFSIPLSYFITASLRPERIDVSSLKALLLKWAANGRFNVS